MTYQKFTWRRGFLSKTTTIYEGGKPLGTINWHSLTGKKAAATWRDDRYWLKPPASKRKCATVYRVPSGETLEKAVFKGFVRRVFIPDKPGEYLHWTYANFWQTRWQWRSGSLPVISYRLKSRLGAEKGEILVHEQAMHSSMHLVVFGLFIRRCMQY